MLENEFNRIFARNLQNFLDEKKIMQKDLAEKLGVSTSVVYYWLNAQRTPRIDKIDKMCEMFGCTREDLITDNARKPKEIPITDGEKKMIYKFRTLDSYSKRTIEMMIDREYERNNTFKPVLMAAHNDKGTDETAEMLTDAERIDKLD